MNNGLKHPFRLFGFAIFALCAAALFFAAATQAQITKTQRVVINPSDQILDIGEFIRIYPEDENGKIPSYRNVIESYKNDLGGYFEDGNVVNLSMPAKSSWGVFTVKNNTFQEDWVLDFGKTSQGRHMFFHKLLVRDHTNGTSHLRALREPGRTDGMGAPLIGEALQIKIPTGKITEFVLFFESEGGLANTFSPRLMTYDVFLKKLRSGDMMTILARSFFISIMICFMAIAYIKSDRRFGFFTLYYFINALLFILLSENFFAALPMLGNATAVLFMLSGGLGLVLTYFFLELSPKKNAISTRFFIGLACLLGLSAVLNLAYHDAQSWISAISLYLPLFITFGTLSVIAFIHGENGKFAAHYFAGAWLISFVALMISMLAAFGVIGAGAISLNMYFLSLLPQSLVFVTAIMKRSNMMDLLRKKQEKRQVQMSEREAEMRHEKETEEQARLLRVIEREREMMAELREREAQRAEEMRIAKEAADEANRAKGAFLAVVSHEIRTPMNGILGMVRLLMDTKLSRQQHDYAGAIKESGDTMMALLNDILDFEKIEAGNMSLEYIDFDLHKLINGVVMLMSGHASEKGIYLKGEIAPSVPQYIKGDPTRLRQVITNLVNNAIKFTENGGVRIVLNRETNEDSAQNLASIRLDVVDTGIGISEEGKEKLFKPFEQAESSTTRKYGGTGLGLTICQRLIEAMNSEIYVESLEGRGSTFGAVIDFETSSSAAVEDSAPAPSKTGKENGPSQTVLIVEDNDMNRRVLNGLLEKYGHKADMASSAEEALKKLEQRLYDLVLTDINMDGMSGLEMAEKIRAHNNPAISGLPIIALTGNTHPDEIEKIHEAGIEGYLSKPVNPEQLAETIKTVTERKEDDHSANEQMQTAPAQNETQPKQSAYTNNKDELTPLQRHALELQGGAPPAQATTQPQQESAFEEYVPAPPPSDQTPHMPEQEQNAILDAQQGAGKGSDNDADSDVNYADIFDLPMLQGLLESLGKEAFKGLIDGYQETADSLVETLSSLSDSDDAEIIRARAHELKGMAANFGVKVLSDVAKIAEDNAKDGDLDIAKDAITKMPAANDKAKSHLMRWIEEQ